MGAISQDNITFKNGEEEEKKVAASLGRVLNLSFFPDLNKFIKAA